MSCNLDMYTKLERSIILYGPKTKCYMVEPLFENEIVTDFMKPEINTILLILSH